MTRLLCTLALTAALVSAASLDHPTGNRTTPPTLEAVSPLGVARGTTTEINVEGLNLANASAVYFSEPGITGKILRVKELPDKSDIRLGSNGTPSTIDLGPLPPRNQVTVEVDVSEKAEIGAVSFRLQTPLGTSPEGRFLIEPYYGEVGYSGPDNETFLPAILTGSISKPGQADLFKIKAKAGEEWTFYNGASLIGSTLQPVISILDQDEKVIKEFEKNEFAFRFERAGTYYVRIGDFQQSGRSSNFYRMIAGKFPLLERGYPLGIQAGQSREIALTGWNLKSPKLTVEGKPSPGYEDAILLRPDHTFNEIKLAVSSDASTYDGKLDKPGKSASYRFHARKGQKLVLEVNARRLGSDLDSFLEVLDKDGKPIERATVRATWETNTTLSDRDSVTPGIRLLGWSDLKPGDYVMVGAEIIKVDILPKGPDEDTFFERFAGQRVAFFDTTPEAHAADQPVYKIQIHPPGAKFSNNGLPQVHLYYQNDDGGPGYGKDSLIHFTAPADGEYIARIRDAEGLGGENHAYRLTIREPRPDFRLALSNRNPNIPLGSCVPENVTALRMDEFDGPIQVSVQNLPSGITATGAVIARGQVNTTLILCAAASARLDKAAPLRVTGKAANLTREANPDDPLKLISLMPAPDVVMTAETQELTIPQGGSAKVTVSIKRQNDFGGRVPIDVRNLPPHVLVPDVGLNGILLNETETRRTFTIEALPDAVPEEQMIYVGGMVETRSPLSSVYAAPRAIKLKIVPHAGG